MLQISDSTWCKEETVLKHHATEFFQQLYHTIRDRNFQPVLNQCSHSIRVETDVALLASITMEEVRRAVFQIAPLKAPDLDGING